MSNSKDKYIFLHAEGLSMAPVFIPGDRIMVRMCPAEGLIPGDIIVFLLQGRLVAHRFLMRKNNQIVAKGDNASYTELFTVRSFIGLVVAIERRGEKRTVSTRSFLFRWASLYFIFYSILRYLFRSQRSIFEMIPRILRGRRALMNLLPSYPLHK